MPKRFYSGALDFLTSKAQAGMRIVRNKMTKSAVASYCFVHPGVTWLVCPGCGLMTQSIGSYSQHFPCIEYDEKFNNSLEDEDYVEIVDELGNASDFVFPPPTKKKSNKRQATAMERTNKKAMKTPKAQEKDEEEDEEEDTTGQQEEEVSNSDQHRHFQQGGQFERNLKAVNEKYKSKKQLEDAIKENGINLKDHPPTKYGGRDDRYHTKVTLAQVLAQQMMQ